MGKADSAEKVSYAFIAGYAAKSTLSMEEMEAYKAVQNQMNTCVLHGESINCTPSDVDAVDEAMAESVSDIYGGITSAELYGYWGHVYWKKDIRGNEYMDSYYWDNPFAYNAPNKEFFAEYFSFQMTQATDKINYTCQWLAGGCDFVDTLVQKMASS